MSHFSIIKTTVSQKSLLTRALDELKISYKEDENSNILIDLKFNKINNKIFFQWEKTHYNLVTDLETWENEKLINVFLQKILLRYHFLNVLSASTKASLLPKSIEFNEDKVKLVLETY
uniref:Conserved hypothetical plastid protein n=1 Tax=Olisthodiscus luteus TaxID=83000 RepID=A0A7U0QGI1_OLILU|nr:conserved hypothetical plastid protein [Olisthodiscus luteus]QQW50472.1 conserved hypothetical plastid protein [Olisthodiscus luteus]